MGCVKPLNKVKIPPTSVFIFLAIGIFIASPKSILAISSAILFIIVGLISILKKID